MAKFKYKKADAQFFYSNGREVSPQAMNQWVRDSIDNAKKSLREDSQKLVDRKITLAQWREKMREHIRAGHRNMAKLAYGPQLNAKELGRLGAIVKVQYKFLDSFAASIKKRKVERSAALVNRSTLYLDALWATYQNELKRAKKDAGYDLAENHLNDEADSCQECPELTDKGVISIDDMPNVGTRECSIGCKCWIEYFRSNP